MTKEEAITILKDISWQMGSVKRWENIEAIDMAIEALQAEQVTSKLKNPCDSLLTEESNGSKEQKSKLEHDREWIIGCIKHDGFIKTDRFDKANQIILEALSADVVSREKYEEVKAYMDTLVDAFIEDGEELAESVKVVRCKDCRWWSCKDSLHQHNSHLCRYWKSTNTSADDFCSYGERRKSEKEYLDKTFPEHDGGEWFDITDMMTGESKK